MREGGREGGKDSPICVDLNTQDQFFYLFINWSFHIGTRFMFLFCTKNLAKIKPS